MASEKHGAFISHINEEKPVAAILQKYLKLAFGDGFRVFVSTDKASIPGGQKWFGHIIENLRGSKVILVLVSQESKRREWTNFESGFGDGQESLVIPIAIKAFPLGQLSFPLAGYQGRSIDDLAAILADVGNHIGQSPAPVSQADYAKEIAEAEAQLIYRSLMVEPVMENGSVRFDLSNAGNTDIELLMLEVLIPFVVLRDDLLFGPEIEISSVTQNGRNYRWLGCYSPRGVYDGRRPILRPVLTPSMGKFRPRDFAVPIRQELPAETQQVAIYYRLHAIGYSTEMEGRRLVDISAV